MLNTRVRSKDAYERLDFIGGHFIPIKCLYAAAMLASDKPHRNFSLSFSSYTRENGFVGGNMLVTVSIRSCIGLESTVTTVPLQ